MSRPTLYIYTDGASSGNPGPGGYGAILVCGNYEKEISKGFRLTTNNRMELLAVIDAIKLVKWDNANIVVTSDSKYVVESIEKGWLNNWVKKGFKNKKNPDLWREYLLVSKPHNVKFKWIKGHNGHPMNERCDQLAVNAGKIAENIDHGYENSPNTLL